MADGVAQLFGVRYKEMGSESNEIAPSIAEAGQYLWEKCKAHGLLSPLGSIMDYNLLYIGWPEYDIAVSISYEQGSCSMCMSSPNESEHREVILSWVLEWELDRGSEFFRSSTIH